MVEKLEKNLERFGISRDQVQDFPDSDVIVNRITDIEGKKSNNSKNGIILTRLVGYLTNNERFEIKRDISGSYSYKTNNTRL